MFTGSEIARRDALDQIEEDLKSSLRSEALVTQAMVEAPTGGHPPNTFPFRFEPQVGRECLFHAMNNAVGLEVAACSSVSPGTPLRRRVVDVLSRRWELQPGIVEGIIDEPGSTEQEILLATTLLEELVPDAELSDFGLVKDDVAGLAARIASSRALMVGALKPGGKSGHFIAIRWCRFPAAWAYLDSLYADRGILLLSDKALGLRLGRLQHGLFVRYISVYPRDPEPGSAEAIAAGFAEVAPVPKPPDTSDIDVLQPGVTVYPKDPLEFAKERPMYDSTQAAIDDFDKRIDPPPPVPDRPDFWLLPLPTDFSAPLSAMTRRLAHLISDGTSPSTEAARRWVGVPFIGPPEYNNLGHDIAAVGLDRPEVKKWRSDMLGKEFGAILTDWHFDRGWIPGAAEVLEDAKELVASGREWLPACAEELAAATAYAVNPRTEPELRRGLAVFVKGVTHSPRIEHELFVFMLRQFADDVLHLRRWLSFGEHGKVADTYARQERARRTRAWFMSWRAFVEGAAVTIGPGGPTEDVVREEVESMTMALPKPAGFRFIVPPELTQGEKGAYHIASASGTYVVKQPALPLKHILRGG